MKRFKTRPSLFAPLLLGALLFTPLRNLPLQAQEVAAVAKTYPLPIAPVAKEEKFAEQINKFWEADKKQLPPRDAVLFIGSSSIRLWDSLAKDFAEIPVINRGFGGSIIEESTRYADRIVLPYAPKIVVLASGGNDLALAGRNPEEVLKSFENFVTKVHEALPDTRIVYISTNPSVSRWKLEAETLKANYLIETFILKNNSPRQKLNYINTHAEMLTPDGQPPATLLRADNLHLNAEGYKKWLSIIKPRLLFLADLDGVKRLIFIPKTETD